MGGICLYLYLTLDDSLRIHERVGSRLADLFDASLFGRLHPQDAGELGVCLITGVIALAALAVAEDLATELASRAKEAPA